MPVVVSAASKTKHHKVSHAGDESGGFLTRLKAKAKNITSSRELKKKEDNEVEVCPYNAKKSLNSADALLGDLPPENTWRWSTDMEKFCLSSSRESWRMHRIILTDGFVCWTLPDVNELRDMIPLAEVDMCRVMYIPGDGKTIWDFLTAKEDPSNTIDDERNFNKFDRDGSGVLDKNEFKEAAGKLDLEFTQNQVEELFKEYDVDGSGSIDIAELRRMVKGHLSKPCTCQTYLIEISTFPHGFNSGKMYFLRCKDKDQALSLVKDIEICKEKYRRYEASRTPWWRVQQANVAKVYASEGVQMLVAALIIGNFFANTAQSELLPEGGSDADILFQRIDDFFTWIFFLEILLNLAANWFSNFFHDGWSCFDLLVVTVSMIAYFLPGDSSGPMKSIRLMRAFRVMRLFGRLQSLRQIISSLTTSILPVLNAFFIMLLVTSIYAILGVNFFSEDFPESFGTFSRALFSMFQVCTGDSWATELARPIMLKTNPDGTIDLVPCFFFISFIVIVGWVLLQVVVAVLLDNFTEASYQEKMRKEQEKLKNGNFVQKVHILDPLLAGLAHFDTAEDLTERMRLFFQVLDSDDSGSLSFQEFADGLRKFRVKPRIELSKSDWNTMTLNGSMLNENQELGLGEFIRMMKSEFKFYVQRQMSNAMDSSNPDKDQKTSAILFVMKLVLVRLDELHNGLDYNPTKEGQDRMGILEEKMDMILNILKNTTENLLPQTGVSNPSPHPRRMEKNAVLEEIIQRQDSNGKELPQEERTEVPAKVEAPAKVRIGRELISCETLSSKNSLPASLAGRKRQQMSANADAVLNRNVGEIRKMPDDKKLKKRVIYECWAYKRGEKSGLLQSSAYKKRYFVITDDHQLCYYKTKEHYCKGEPRGWLSCDGMLVKERRGTEAIEGRTCFVFTIQAQEGSRTSEIPCACHTSTEREQLLATIESIASMTEKKRELEVPGRSWEGLQPKRRAKDAEQRENRLQGSDMQSDVQRQQNGGPILNLDGEMPIATQTKSPSLEGSRLLLPRTGTQGLARDLPANAELGYASTAFIGSSHENNAAGTKANPLQDSTAHCL